MVDKLSIKNEMAMVDGKVRDFYDDLTEDERKKFSPYVLMKFSANVSGNLDLAEYYLRRCNDTTNKDFFNINKHPKLQWLCTTTISPKMGNTYHYWLTTPKNGSTSNKERKFLQQIYPNAKEDELELLVKINTKADLKEHARQLGWSDKEIKDAFK
jgi:hypothetical protein